MMSRLVLRFSGFIGSQQLKFTSLVGLVLTSIALIVLGQNYYKYAGVAEYSVKLSLVYNLIVYCGFALFTPLILKVTDSLNSLAQRWAMRLPLHLLASIVIALLHMFFSNLVLYTVDLSSTPILTRFMTKYLTNVVQVHLLMYWAIILLRTFYQGLTHEKGNKQVPSSPEVLSHFVVKENGRSFKLSFDEVYWIEALDHYQKLHTDRGYHLIKDSMKNLETQLPANIFKRAHRSYFVNQEKVISILRNSQSEKGVFVNLQNGTKLKLGQSYTKRFSE